MKLHKINFNKVFNLKLLKTKVYTKQKKINHNKNKMVELHLKKAFSIIYKYHTTNKKILFIGTPVNKNQQFNHLLLNTNHIFIPEFIWINGTISNSYYIFKHLFKQSKLNPMNKKKSNYLFKLDNTYNLIVILNEKLNNIVLKEALTKGIPIISLNCNDTLLNFHPATYQILGNFDLINKKTRNNAFYNILKSILKKAKKFKESKKKITYFKKPKYKKKLKYKHRFKNA